MNRPSLSARVAASVPGAIVIFLVCTGLGAGWYQGQFPWWLALGAVFGALRTIDAIQRVRRYRAWRAEWNAMGGAAPVKKRGGTLTKVAATIAVLALLAMAGARDDPQTQNDQAFVVGMPVMFGASTLYLLASLALVTVRRRRQAARRRDEARKEQARAEAEAAPVTWLLPPASSSPSRADAVRNLPDYCTRLITESQARRETVMKSAVTAVFVVVSVALTSAQNPAPQPVEDRAARGDAAAQYEIARRYLAEGKTLNALVFLSQAAMNSYAPAEFQVGLISLSGAGGFPRDYKTAAGWFKVASDHSDLKARAMLGKMHLFTKFGMVDHALAARLLEDPANQGDPESQLCLGGVNK